MWQHLASHACLRDGNIRKFTSQCCCQSRRSALEQQMVLQIQKQIHLNPSNRGCQPFERRTSPSPQCSSITPGAMTERRTEGGHSPHRYSPADKCQRLSLEDRAFRALNLPQRKEEETICCPYLGLLRVSSQVKV
ncbi:hypothetical protein QQF64_014487 [Cirrhinus molitorella]|uniref:Uncharacterized protein n=1 Tax=Cirrhinus molitorella TaxID=172907 RepID=A0ABR3NS80_9TELE